MDWEKAYGKEIQKLTDIGKMKVTKKPKNAQVIPIFELFNRKEDSLPKENIFKCRFFARGDLVKNNENENLYSPVCSLEVTRISLPCVPIFKER